jgi:hypothetical protein
MMTDLNWVKANSHLNQYAVRSACPRPNDQGYEWQPTVNASVPSMSHNKTIRMLRLGLLVLEQLEIPSYLA